MAAFGGVAEDAYHIPVLRDEVVANLLTSSDGVYVDATIGGGGHAEAILMHLSPGGRLIGLDRDDEAVAFAERRLQRFEQRVIVIREDFGHMRQALARIGITTVDGILLDLGLSSYQIDQSGRGFSFQRDEPLDMRMDRRQNRTAELLLRDIDEQTLTGILREYGEEFYAKKIARRIVYERAKHPIETTAALAAIVRKVVRGRFVNKSLARVFQAVRIAVNDELETLRNALLDAVALLRPGGRIVAISYHSLEDRIVKETFRREAGLGVNQFPYESARRLRILTKKPITPTEEEIASNSRARSAKMRVAERV